MKRTAPADLFAFVIILCAIGLALAATSPAPAALAPATPVPVATFHYSTVGSCGCEVHVAATITPTLVPGSK